MQGVDAMLREFAAPPDTGGGWTLDPFDLADQVIGGTADWLSGQDAQQDRTGGILYIAPRPGQDRRADVPVIGPEIAHRAVEARLSGTVIEAGYTRANGNYIFLKHGNHIVTRYLHLSKKLTSRGDRVRQGQSIGLVGATGLATGPHLHYEFLVNGRHRDPRRVDLPEAEPLPADKLPEFKAHADSWLAKLEELLPPRVMLASSGGEAGSASESRSKTTTAPK